MSVYFFAPLFRDVFICVFFPFCCYYTILIIEVSFEQATTEFVPLGVFVKGKNEKFHEYIREVFYILAIVTSTGVMIYFYAHSIYKLIPPSFAGGKPLPISYLIGSDTITGKKIYENENDVFLLSKDSTVLKIDLKEIDGILKRPISLKQDFHDKKIKKTTNR